MQTHSLSFLYRKPAVLLSFQNGVLQSLQIHPIWMGKRTVKVFNQRINVCRMFRLIFHFHIALPHRRWHFTLTHIISNHGIACVNGTRSTIEDFLKICRTAAEASCPEQKNFFVSQL